MVTMQILALLAATLANAAFECPQGMEAKTGTPKCAGVAESTCSATTCCTMPTGATTCAATNIVTGGNRCNGGASADKTRFQDLKKSATVLKSSTDDDFIAGCCSLCSEAKCSDWLGMTCPAKKAPKSDTPMGVADCKVPTSAKWQETCCADAAKCSAHTCSTGMEKKANPDSIYCSGTDASTCTDAQCCKPTGTACGVNVVTGNAKCKAGAKAHKFFDLKKKGTEVTGGDKDVFDKCCTDCEKATCGDWFPNFLLTCSTAEMDVDTTKEYGITDCKLPTADAFKEKCCIAKQKKCADYTVGGNEMCKKDGDSMFFDLKKVGNTAATDDDVKGQCCTSCKEATCGDWRPVKLLVTCGADKMFDVTKKYGVDDCTIPSDDDDYKGVCCVDKPKDDPKKDDPKKDEKKDEKKTCAHFTASWVAAKGCTKTPIPDFFDLKKSAAMVKKDGTDDDWKSTCCTACSKATCGDWVKGVKCPSGKMMNPKKEMGSADCAVPTDDKFKETCCEEAMKCADWTGKKDSGSGSDADHAVLSVISSSVFLAVVFPFLF